MFPAPKGLVVGRVLMHPFCNFFLFVPFSTPSVSCRLFVFCSLFIFSSVQYLGRAAAYVVEALCYKPEGRVFDDPGVDLASNGREYREYNSEFVQFHRTGWSSVYRAYVSLHVW
jgi:hypothetical protein